MSLSLKQKADTKKELKANFARSGLTMEQTASDLGTTVSYIGDLFRLQPRRLEDAWILRNDLIRAVKEKGEEPVPFTALKNDWHSHWFLDGSYIDNGIITR